MTKSELLWLAKSTKALLEKGETTVVIDILDDVIKETETAKE